MIKNQKRKIKEKKHTRILGGIATGLDLGINLEQRLNKEKAWDITRKLNFFLVFNNNIAVF